MCQQLCKLSVQEICTFSTYGINLYQHLSLCVQITFHMTKCYETDYTLNLENIFSIHPIAKVLLHLWKRTMKPTDKEKDSNWIADCSYCNFLLIRNMTVWLFNDYLYLQFSESAIIIGTIFAVYFFKILCYFSCWNCWKKIWSIAHQLYFLNTTYFVGIVKDCI